MRAVLGGDGGEGEDMGRPMTTLHFMIGNGIRCDFSREAPNACDDWSRVTCRSCLRLHRDTLRRSIRHLEGYLEEGLPPSLVGEPRWTREAMVGRLERHRETLGVVERGLGG